MWEFLYKTKEIITSKAGLSTFVIFSLVGLIIGVVIPTINKSSTSYSDVVAYNRNGTSGTYEVWKNFISPNNETQKWGKNVLEVSGNDKMASNINTQIGSVGYVAGSSFDMVNFDKDPNSKTYGMPSHKKNNKIKNTTVVGLDMENGKTVYPNIKTIVDGGDIVLGEYTASRNFNSLWRGEAINLNSYKEAEKVFDITQLTNPWDNIVGISVNEGIAWVFYNYIADGKSGYEIKIEHGTVPTKTFENHKYEDSQINFALRKLEEKFDDEVSKAKFITQGSTSVLDTISFLARKFSSDINIGGGIVMPEIIGADPESSQFVGFMNNSGHEGSGDAFKKSRLKDTFIGFQSREAKDSEFINPGLNMPANKQDEYIESGLYQAYTKDPLIIIANNKGFDNWDFTLTLEELNGIYITGETKVSDLQ